MKKTMKQYSFASRLKSLALVFGIALAFASCANDDFAYNWIGSCSRIIYKKVYSFG